MRRKPASRSLAEIAGDVIAPLAERHGHATADLILRWAEIAGPDLARFTRPLRVNWPRRSDGGTDTSAGHSRPAGAILIVACESAHALDLQFAGPAIIERANLLYGWQAIGRLTIRQGPARQKTAPQPRKNLPEAPADLADRLTAVSDSDLNHALRRLAQGIGARRQRS